jgi:hypothetical protein
MTTTNAELNDLQIEFISSFLDMVFIFHYECFSEPDPTDDEFEPMTKQDARDYLLSGDFKQWIQDFYDQRMFDEHLNHFGQSHEEAFDWDKGYIFNECILMYEELRNNPSELYDFFGVEQADEIIQPEQ